jgi:nitrate reductase NapE component
MRIVRFPKYIDTAEIINLKFLWVSIIPLDRSIVILGFYVKIAWRLDIVFGFEYLLQMLALNICFKC